MTQHALIIAAMVIGVWLAADIAALIWLRQLAGYKLLIIDELGYVPLTATGSITARAAHAVPARKRRWTIPPRLNASRKGPSSVAGIADVFLLRPADAFLLRR